MLSDLVLYDGPSVGAVGGGGVGFLVCFHVHAAIVLSLLLLSLSERLVLLGMPFYTLGYNVTISGNLRDGGIFTVVCGSGGISVTYTLVDVCSFTCTSARVKRWGCLMGGILLSAGAWSLIKFLDAVTSLSRSHIDVSPFPLDIHLAVCLRLWVALNTLSTCC